MLSMLRNHSNASTQSSSHAAQNSDRVSHHETRREQRPKTLNATLAQNKTSIMKQTSKFAQSKSQPEGMTRLQSSLAADNSSDASNYAMSANSKSATTSEYVVASTSGSRSSDNAAIKNSQMTLPVREKRSIASGRKRRAEQNFPDLEYHSNGPLIPAEDSPDSIVIKNAVDAICLSLANSTCPPRHEKRTKTAYSADIASDIVEAGSLALEIQHEGPNPSLIFPSINGNDDIPMNRACFSMGSTADRDNFSVSGNSNRAYSCSSSVMLDHDLESGLAGIGTSFDDSLTWSKELTTVDGWILVDPV